MWVYVCGFVTAYNTQQTLAFKLKNNQKKKDIRRGIELLLPTQFLNGNNIRIRNIWIAKMVDGYLFFSRIAFSIYLPSSSSHSLPLPCSDFASCPDENQCAYILNRDSVSFIFVCNLFMQCVKCVSKSNLTISFTGTSFWMENYMYKKKMKRKLQVTSFAVSSDRAFIHMNHIIYAI